MTELVRPIRHILQTIDVLLRLGHWEAALAAIDAVAALHPDMVALALFRGWLALDQNKPQQAAVAFRLAAGRDPTEPLVWHGLAGASADPLEQTAAAERAQLLNPQGSYVQVWHDLRAGKPHLAVTTLHAFHQRFPDRAELIIWFAEVQRRLGNEEAARATLDPLLRRRPRSAPALFLAAALCLDGLQAQQYLDDALRLDPLAASATRLFTPMPLPFRVSPQPVVGLSPQLADTLDQLVPGAAVPATPVWNAPPTPPTRVVRKSANAPTMPPPHDPDTAAALHVVEQATQRLFGRTPLVHEAERTTALLVTHRGALAASYGMETAAAIIAAMTEYGSALGSRAVQAECIVVDDRESLGRIANIAPVAETTAAAFKQVIEAVRTALTTAGHDVDALVLIGGDAIVPFHRVPNPSQDADVDVPTDNPYGSGAGSELAPELIVARFPDGGADGGRLLLEQLQRVIDYHQHWHLAGPQGGVLTLPFMRRFAKPLQGGGPVVGWGISAAAWQLPSETVYGELGSTRPLVLCPPATPDTLEAAWPPDGRLLYFNVHGIQGGPNWYGQAVDGPSDGALPVVLTPDDIGAVAPAMICVSEACFGAEILGRSPADAIALRLLQRGALAFIGSTVTAYGAVTLPLGGADLLVQQTLHNLRRGYPVGRAAALARDWMAREMVQRQGYLDPDDAKTLLSFVLLGDPWATPYTRPVLERKTSLPRLQPVVVQRRPVAPNLVAPAAATVARQLLAKVAPNLARADLIASGQGRPDRIAKGQANAVVFSATDALRTNDGQALAQVARVTVVGGEARKLLLSR